MSIEGTANTEYASLSGKIRTFVVDKSLTVSGACADSKVTGDAINKLIDDAATAGEEAAIKTTNEKLANFLDSTLTKTDKAAQAAAVGKVNDRLGELRNEFNETCKMKKIAEVNITETITDDFYIELPETLSHYEYILVKAADLYRQTNTMTTPVRICVVESLTSAKTGEELFTLNAGIDGNYANNRTTAQTVYLIENELNGLTAYDPVDHDDYCKILDTKYLYVYIGANQAPALKLLSGGHIEMWGVAK